MDNSTEEQQDICPLCRSKNCKIEPVGDFNGERIKCMNCFTFKLHEGIQYGNENEGMIIRHRLNAIYSFLLKNPVRSINGFPYYYFYIDNNGESEDPTHINVSSLLLNYPKTLLEKVDKILYNLSLRHPTYNDYLQNQDMNPAMFYCESKDVITEMYIILQFMQDYGYIDKSGTMITLKGWERIDELRKKNDTLKQGFIAMWFPSKDNAKFELMNKIRGSIKRAIEDSGFHVMVIDEKEHNNQIVPEILFEIKNSKFMVADITGHRNGVYYEAGIMEGMGREVIVCCDKTDFDNRHFDIAQKSAIVYENENDLYEKLINRIRATI